MLIKRHLQPRIESILTDGQIAIVYGARQVGKTTLARQVSEGYQNPLYLNCDDPLVVASLTKKSAVQLKAYIGNPDLVIIDEAQRVENIGISIKLLHDTYPDIRLLVTGSSSLDLANKVTEPLTGRSQEVQLFPFSVREVSSSPAELEPNALIALDRGGYPAFWHISAEQAHRKLQRIANEYVFRDAFSPNVIYDQTIINDLLRLLAYQIGSEVNYSELASRLSITQDTVLRYVDLLEKAFIVFRRNQYRRNQRSQVGRLRKVYFVDLGIRNAIIGNFKPLELRDDVGGLWENFCAIERLKYLQTTDRFVKSFYWRGADGREIDIVEEEGELVRAFECKFGTQKNAKRPVGYTRDYPKSSFSTVNPQNFAEQLFS